MTRRGNYKFFGKYSWYMPGVGGMLALLAWLLLGAAIGAVLTIIMGAVCGPDSITKYGTLLSYPIMFVPPMLWAAVKSSTAAMNTSGYKLDSNNFSPLHGAVCAVLAAAGTIVMGFWADALAALLPPMPEPLAEAMASLTNGNIWISLLCVSVLAPFCEEWLCRGMILRGLLARKMNPALAIIISAFFFAFIHLNPWQAIPAFLLGCLFGYVYYKTGSLKLTMFMHFVNNTLAVFVGRIEGWEEMNSWKDVIPTQPYYILLAASVLFTILVVLAFRKIRLKSPVGNMDPVPSLFESNEI